ncbi:STAS domain-containing protein [Streptomyces xanthophaeus]|uniref:STAS domain-containing protein n=1 Tax=Streptomyces xanthophaeus TaxID=67385 RepID=UPI00068BB2C9|nr:STAS domain-containing protein [Streptomyces xanthophaeus]WST20189.1 STAS domain-containing protein [Streptomyces xanthophaeus]WST64826.1 STAS domain-containing protein [Streptomyces xanthophaeus]
MAQRPSPEADGNDIAVEILDHAVAIRPSGEIDIETAPALRLALTEALAHASPARPVAVDCTRVSFCDSTGLNALLSARRAAQENGITIRLAAPNHQLLRLLDMTGALPLFPVDQDRQTGDRAPARGPDGPPR